MNSVIPIAWQTRLWIPVCLILLAGCSPSEIKPKGDELDARVTLREALEAWQSGQTPDDFKEATSPAVIVVDNDWKTGKKLQSFELTEEPQLNGSHWRVFVQIAVGDDKQSAVPERVCYAVTIGSPVSIIRSDTLN